MVNAQNPYSYESSQPDGRKTLSCDEVSKKAKEEE